MSDSDGELSNEDGWDGEGQNLSTNYPGPLVLDPSFVSFANFVLAADAHGLIPHPPVRAPNRVPRLTGDEYVRELLEKASDRYFFNQARMTKVAFLRLCDTLVDSGWFVEHPRQRVKVHEAVMIFIYIVEFNSTMRQACDRFQRSTDTIHRQFHMVLGALCNLAQQVIRPYNNNPHPSITRNPRRAVFQGCVGAMDGSFIHTIVPREAHARSRNRHALLGQTLMAVCDFDLLFTYVCPGWEASAHDGRVFDELICSSPNNFPLPPEDSFIVADSAFPNLPGFLAPFSDGTPYHNTDQAIDGAADKQTLFNMRHSSVRNVIERCFGVLKRRWRMLRNTMENYNHTCKPRIVLALCGLHNFCRLYGGPEDMLGESDLHISELYPHYLQEHDPLARDTAAVARAKRFREDMADAIWADAVERNDFN